MRYKFNTRFKDSLDTLAEKQRFTLRVLGRIAPLGDDDEDDELHYCKIIGLMIADAYNDTQGLASHLFSIQDPEKHNDFFNQIKHRLNECMWIAEKHRALGDKIEAVYQAILDVFHNAEYSSRVLECNPDDFTKFDNAHDRLDAFFKNRVTKTEPNN
jgi:hypothetical protein